MNQRLLLFALLTLTGAVLILPFVGAAASYFLYAPADSELLLSESVRVYFLTIVFGAVIAVTALPLTVPFGLAGWFVSHRVLSTGVRQKWRIRIVAVTSGLTASAGFMLGVALFANDEKWLSISLIVGVAVLIASMISAEIVYRPAKRGPV